MKKFLELYKKKINNFYHLLFFCKTDSIWIKKLLKINIQFLVFNVDVNYCENFRMVETFRLNLIHSTPMRKFYRYLSNLYKLSREYSSFDLARRMKPNINSVSCWNLSFDDIGESVYLRTMENIRRTNMILSIKLIDCQRRII